MKTGVFVEISLSRKAKIAWDMGRRRGDLPDEGEIADWLYQKVNDFFDEMPEAAYEENLKKTKNNP